MSNRRQTRSAMLRRAPAVVLLLGLGGCAGYAEFEPPPVADLANIQQASVSCGTWTDTGYQDGTPFSITLVTIDGKPAEIDTANAYIVMQEAAASAGVDIRVVSGFRTYAEQEYLYGCYVHCNCNDCNQAAAPGYSNHQSGHALDLNTSSSPVLSWLNSHGGSFGFKRTVSGEPWHWEWWGGGPGGGPCNGGNTVAPCTLTSGEVGVCMDTGSCAELGGSHVSTSGLCPGPANIQCCTGSTACTIGTGASGECLTTTACAALGDHESSAGFCPGPANVQCCTSTVAPPGPDASVPGPDAAQDSDAGEPALDAESAGGDAGELGGDAGIAPDAAVKADAGQFDGGQQSVVGSGCGCGASGTPLPWWLGLLLLGKPCRASRSAARAVERASRLSA
ncbi:MAG: M15 family metallopeptidase [Myxococcales bacterium]